MGDLIQFPQDRLNGHGFVQPHVSDRIAAASDIVPFIQAKSHDRDILFLANIVSERIGELSQYFIGSLIHKEDYTTPELSVPIRPSQDESDLTFGVCEFVGSNSSYGSVLRIDSSFVDFLTLDNNVSPEEAADIAAIYVRSLAVMDGALRHTRGKISTREIRLLNRRNTKYWKDNSNIPNVNMPMVNHMLAGRVAVEYVEFIGKTIDTKLRPPYPNHIAGILDPAPKAKGLNSEGTICAFYKEIVHHAGSPLTNIRRI